MDAGVAPEVAEAQIAEVTQLENIEDKQRKMQEEQLARKEAEELEAGLDEGLLSLSPPHSSSHGEYLYVQRATVANDGPPSSAHRPRRRRWPTRWPRPPTTTRARPWPPTTRTASSRPR